ncbi:MAG: zf-HC2 domain-containing protein [Acidobacteria bacterium]|nr:zf-HC2 domain-containing protein [Acidobacteriota bacterium]
MECREVRQLADSFVSEQLLVETTHAVLAHLDRCPPCRREVEGLRRLRAATRSAFEGAPYLSADAGFAAALTSQLRAGAARQQTAHAPRRLWLAIAASVLLVVGAGLGWREWSAASGISALLHAAVGDHRFCALTFKLAETPISLEEAARRYGGVDGLLETVEPSTPILTGGPMRILERHSCVFDGRRFAHIVLSYKDETVSLLVTDDPHPGGAPWGKFARKSDTTSALPVTDGFHVASFRGARHAVFVVSSLNAADVQEVAEAMLGPVSRALPEA